MPAESELHKILFLAPTGQLGGAERCLVDTIWSLRNHDSQLELHLITGSNGPLVNAAEKAGLNSVQILKMPSSLNRIGDAGLRRDLKSTVTRLFQLVTALPHTFQYIVQLRRRIKQANPDIVHVLGLKMQLMSLLAVPRRYPIAWNIQDYIGQRRLISRLMQLSLFLFGFDKSIVAGCCSNDVTTDFQTTLGTRRFRRIATIYNTVDLDQFQPAGPCAALPNADETTIRIGLVATYARWKGQDLFLKALAILQQNKTLPAWHAYIIGGPIYATAGSQWSLEELKSMADDLYLNNQATFLPFQQDPAAVMRTLDIVVHASTKPEPFGRVIAEAQACGRAVVAVGSGGSGEAFLENETGMAIAMNDEASLTNALNALLTNASERQRLSGNGRAFVTRHFNRENLAAGWLAIYNVQNHK